MEEHSDSASAFGSGSSTNGDGSVPSSGAGTSSGSSTSKAGQNGSSSGSDTLSSRTVPDARSSAIERQAQTQMNGYADSGAAAGGGGPAGAASAAPTANGMHGAVGNNTIGGKNFATKRSRMNGLPPPVYTPLGASSPSLSSNNAPAFSNAGGSGSSSAATTPSASPQQNHGQLLPPGPPATSSYGHQQAQGGPGNQSGANEATNPRQYPALHLYPLNDTFIPKQVSLYPPGPHNRIKIGRQTNAKTVPAPNNGYFDSKVLSRAHAEVWCEGGKVYIKDVKSSNGTFINGERLSPEAVESDVFELHNNDMVEFGIDITSEDTKTIVHHKVAARCYLVLNADDAAATSRNFASYYREMDEASMHRRAGLGNKSMGTPGLNLDQVLGRLQTELAKSRELGTDLSSFSGNLTDIHDTLGGNLPGPPLPAYRVPPFVPPNPNAPLSPQQAAQQSQQQTQQMLSTLQGQLHETQTALNGQVERIRLLEGRSGEQDRIKTDFKELVDRMEVARQDWERLKESQRLAQESADEDVDSDKEELAEGEADDTRTIRLEVGLNGLIGQEQSARSEESDTESRDLEKEDLASTVDHVATSQRRLAEEYLTLSDKVRSLSNELTAARSSTLALESQYTQAAGTVRDLEEKVRNLESALQQQERRLASTSPAAHDGKATSAASHDKDEILREVESRFTDWKKSFEDAVKREREGWQEERERLRVAVQEWERKSSLLEQQAAASSSRRKRKGKASTTGSASELSTSESGSDDSDEGLISPVTDDSSVPASTSNSESPVLDALENVKRPRSRRRRRVPGGTSKVHRKKSSSSNERSTESQYPATLEKEMVGGGSAPQRRRSWIPFAQNLSDLGNPDTATRDAIRSEGHGQTSRRSKQPALYEHPAVPLVSAAGIVVIGYLAYTAVMQHQK